MIPREGTLSSDCTQATSELSRRPVLPEQSGSNKRPTFLVDDDDQMARVMLTLVRSRIGAVTIIAMTMRYTSFHLDCSDVGKYFENAGERLGLAGSGNCTG